MAEIDSRIVYITVQAGIWTETFVVRVSEKWKTEMIQTATAQANIIWRYMGLTCMAGPPPEMQQIILAIQEILGDPAAKTLYGLHPEVQPDTRPYKFQYPQAA